MSYMKHTVKVYLFSDKGVLNLMLSLRGQGWSYDALGFLFGCDPTAIIYQCQRYGIDPEEDIIGLQEVIKQLVDEADKWYYVDGQKINKGKSYKDYLRSPRK